MLKFASALTLTLASLASADQCYKARSSAFFTPDLPSDVQDVFVVFHDPSLRLFQLGQAASPWLQGYAMGLDSSLWENQILVANEDKICGYGTVASIPGENDEQAVGDEDIVTETKANCNCNTMVMSIVGASATSGNPGLPSLHAIFGADSIKVNFAAESVAETAPADTRTTVRVPLQMYDIGQDPYIPSTFHGIDGNTIKTAIDTDNMGGIVKYLPPMYYHGAGDAADIQNVNADLYFNPAEAGAFKTTFLKYDFYNAGTSATNSPATWLWTLFFG